MSLLPSKLAPRAARRLDHSAQHAVSKEADARAARWTFPRFTFRAALTLSRIIGSGRKLCCPAALSLGLLTLAPSARAGGWYVGNTQTDEWLEYRDVRVAP